jgi:hypothetical protein
MESFSAVGNHATEFVKTITHLLTPHKQLNLPCSNKNKNAAYIELLLIMRKDMSVNELQKLHLLPVRVSESKMRLN